MASTFANVSKSSATNYLFLFAQGTLAHHNDPPTPPPLNALGLPCEGMFRLWARLYPKQAARHKYLSDYLKSIKATGIGMRLAAAKEKAPEEKAAMELEGASLTAENLKIQPLADKIKEYILDHLDDGAQERREARHGHEQRDASEKSFREQREASDKSFHEQREESSKQREIMNKVETEVQSMQLRLNDVHAKLDETTSKLDETIQLIRNLANPAWPIQLMRNLAPWPW